MGGVHEDSVGDVSSGVRFSLSFPTRRSCLAASFFRFFDDFGRERRAARFVDDFVFFGFSESFPAIDLSDMVLLEFLWSDLA
jgi:hypothetical protein